MSLVWWILVVPGVVVGLYVVGTIYLAVVLKWEDEATVGLAYYGRPLAERGRFKRTLGLHARLLAPLLWLNSRLVTVDFRRVRVVHDGVSFPAGSCDAASCAAAVAYRPTAQDVFVVTQMKCGTTWMQHVVYEILRRGAGDLVATGTAMYAVAPWLEGRRSVPVMQAPLHGTERPSRIIKTHLPAHLCPAADGARYIYVARHPASCFASCMDFVATNVGAMAPALPAYEAWFCAKDLMWWGTWADHVRGWWDRAAANRNVLFLYFEDMKRDLAGVAQQVAAFLGVAPLSAAELARVVEKTSFAYMQEHQDSFEMHPPHILQTSAELFVRGSADRHQDVPAEVRGRIVAWAARELAGSGLPLAAKYPDVAAAGKGGGA